MGRKITIKKVKSVESLGQITDAELNELSKEYEPENYDPVGNREESITVRFTKEEKSNIISYIEKKGLKRSTFIRKAILNSLNEGNNIKQNEFEETLYEIHSILKQDIEEYKKYKCEKSEEK